MIHASSWWALETFGWSVDDSGQATAFMPADVPDEAALVVSAYRKSAGPISPEELWLMSGEASPADAERTPVQCGDFGGYTATYDDAEGTHWRVWWLAKTNLHLYATFNCPRAYAGQHDMALDAMLASLSAR